MVSAWGLIMTPTQTLCRSTEMVQKADQIIALLQILTSAEAQSCSPKSIKSSQKVNGAGSFSFSAPLPPGEEGQLHSLALVLGDSFIHTGPKRRAGCSI